MRMMITIVLIITLATMTTLASSKIDELQENNIYCKTVYVKSGDTLWCIASEQVTDKEDIRELIAGIVRVNNLGKNAQIYPGQVLKIPVKKAL